MTPERMECDPAVALVAWRWPSSKVPGVFYDVALLVGRCARAWQRMRARFGRCWNEDDGPSLGTLLDFVRSEHRPSDRREVAERRKKLGKTARWLRNGPRFVQLVDRLVSCDPPGLVRDGDGLPARLYL